MVLGLLSKIVNKQIESKSQPEIKKQIQIFSCCQRSLINKLKANHNRAVKNNSGGTVVVKDR